MKICVLGKLFTTVMPMIIIEMIVVFDHLAKKVATSVHVQQSRADVATLAFTFVLHASSD